MAFHTDAQSGYVGMEVRGRGAQPVMVRPVDEATAAALWALAHVLPNYHVPPLRAAILHDRLYEIKVRPISDQGSHSDTKRMGGMLVRYGIPSP